jgi:hypothetical protein
MEKNGFGALVPCLPPLRALPSDRRRIDMEEKYNDNVFAFELQVKFQARRFRFKLNSKRGLILFLIVLAVKIIASLVRYGPF